MVPSCFVAVLTTKDFLSTIGNITNLCQFSTVWADQTDLGCQKLFSKPTAISPPETHDNFQIKIYSKNYPKSEKVGLPCFQTKKKKCWF